jgi:hypothetical protein
VVDAGELILSRYRNELLANGKRRAATEALCISSINSPCFDTPNPSEIPKFDTRRFDWEYDALGRLTRESFEGTVLIYQPSVEQYTVKPGYVADYTFRPGG